MGNLITSIAAVNGLLALALGIFALWKNPRNSTNQAFALLALFLGIWSLSGLLPFESQTIELIAFGGASLAAAANFHFTKNITSCSQRGLVLTGYFLSLFFFGLLAAPILEFEAFASPSSIELISKAWLVFFLTFLLIPMFLFFTSWQTEDGAKKYQLKFVLGEYFMALIISGGLMALFWNTDLSPETNLIRSPHFASALHLFFIFYFFVEYKFLKLKIIAPDFLKKFLAFCVAAVIALNLRSIMGFLNFEISEKHMGIILVVMVVLVYNLTLRFFDARRWFEAVSLENFRKAVDDFKNKNIFYASVAELQKNIQVNFCPQIGVEEAHVVVLNLDGGESKFPQLEKHFSQSSNYLITSEEEYLAKNKKISCLYLAELKSLGDVCFPLFQHTNELIGFLVIKKGVQNDIYIEEELKLLEGAVHYIALSLMGILYTDKLRQQAERLRDDYERLKTLDDTKDAFIANVSHELRTPATAIKGYADLLASSNFGEVNEKQKDFAQRIEKNTSWLITLLNDILEITKLESDQVKFNFEKVVAKKTLEKIAGKWQKPCEEKKLKFKFDPDGIDANLALRTDYQRLEEILKRLLTNAHKFTEKGEISLSARPAGEFLEISVGDTGIGIPAKKLANIWDKFSQSVDFLEKCDMGTGLGLAIVKKLVENLDGSISAQSELGKGSTFTLLIPLQNE
jgi:signal transduction histidine kinase